jgi:hypothetical protein
MTGPSIIPKLKSSCADLVTVTVVPEEATEYRYPQGLVVVEAEGSHADDELKR